MEELTFDALPANIPVAIDFVNDELKQRGCSISVLSQIDMAIDEVLSNIAFYAYYPETGPVTVLVDFEEDPNAVIITFLDNGRPFNPLEQKDPDVSLPARKRKAGGLGIFVVKKTMDSVEYKYQNRKNTLRIRKEL